MEFTVLLDAPAEPAAEVQLAKLGDNFKDARYGDFSITQAEVEDWKKNLQRLPGGRALIDQDHLSNKPSPHRRTEASGWITDVNLVDGVPKATVEWTPLGEQAIREKRFLFLSPSFGPHQNEQGEVFENTLTGAALTNKPFLDMPMVTLASSDSVRQALRETGAADRLLQLAAAALPDSRRMMELNADILKLLGIEDETEQKKILDLSSAEDADEKKVLEAIEAAKPEEENKPEPESTKTLEQQAKEEGKTLLETERLNKLELDAAAGRKAMDQLSEERFSNAFQKALESGRAVEADKDEYEHFYTLDSDATLKRLKNAKPVVNMQPKGRNHNDLPDDAPEGVHEQSYLLDQETRKYMAEKGWSGEKYLEALDIVQTKAGA